MKNKERELQKQRPPKELIKDLTLKTVRERLGLPKKAFRNPDGSVASGNKKLGTLQNDYERSSELEERADLWE